MLRQRCFAGPQGFPRWRRRLHDFAFELGGAGRAYGGPFELRYWRLASAPLRHVAVSPISCCRRRFRVLEAAPCFGSAPTPLGINPPHRGPAVKIDNHGCKESLNHNRRAK